MLFSIKRLWQSVSFRLTLNYGFLAILTTLILIVFIYFQVMGALRAEYSRQISAAAQRLETVFASGGRDALMAAMDLALRDMVDTDREIYLLLDGNGKKLSGNIEPSPLISSIPIGMLEIEVSRNGVPVHGRMKIQPLSGGEVLVVGSDLNEMNEINALIGQVIMAAIILAVCLTFVGAYIFRKELERRVGHIRQTSRYIGAGQLSRRISLSEEGDEFDLLGRDINAMLDKIELLMKSARHISDTIAHNIRTPLTRITGGLREVQRSGITTTELLTANQQAIEEIEQLNVLLEKLLQIAETEAGIQRRAFKPCNLDSILTDVVSLYEVLAEAKGVVVCVEYLECATVHGDRNMLASALANLLDNAVKYAASRVTIGIFKEKNTARIVIQDDGPGIPASEYTHIGKHFYRLDSKAQGHGLGLTSVLSILNLHSGSLDFADAQPGLVVSLSFPLATEQISTLKRKT